MFFGGRMCWKNCFHVDSVFQRGKRNGYSIILCLCFSGDGSVLWSIFYLVLFWIMGIGFSWRRRSGERHRSWTRVVHQVFLRVKSVILPINIRITMRVLYGLSCWITYSSWWSSCGEPCSVIKNGTVARNNNTARMTSRWVDWHARYIVGSW